MIQTKKDLKYYLERDAIALKCDNKKHTSFFGDEIWKFQRALRVLEYYANASKKNKLLKIGYYISKFKYKKLSLKLGFSIPINAFEEGLSIAHYGLLVVNRNARIGKNCRIQEGVTIGTTNGSNDAPKIGNNVFIGSGAKIIGDIVIADDVAIAANAVVVKSIVESSVTFGGVPAKKISENDSHSNLAPKLFQSNHR